MGAPICQPAHPFPQAACECVHECVLVGICVHECRVQRGKEVTKWVLTLQTQVS